MKAAAACMPVKHDSPYLTQQIIAYIGNKRRLLGLIKRALFSLYEQPPKGLKFLDLFAGSGVVSRLAKSLGFEVHSNDWEEYSRVINSAYLGINRSDIPGLFGSHGHLGELLSDLNGLPDPAPEEQYIARYYAPSCFDVDKADFRKERLFYSRENALIIDKIRNRIESLYPSGKLSLDDRRKKDLLLALLIYEAATHTNTSGVFKACHKGFGGHGRDARKRILARISLKEPVLIDTEYPCRVYKEDALSLVESGRVDGMDVVYLDPPYNQHQYGSNYHMLNTVALWDKIPAPLDLDENGRLHEKAAIRRDWVNTRSDYCYRDKAVNAFSRLLEGITAPYILLSYSTDGIIPFDELRRLCEQKGKVRIVMNEYTKYRGGKQSNRRRISNLEFILIVDTSGENTPRSKSALDKLVLQKELSLLFKGRYSHRKLSENFSLHEEGLTARLPGRTLTIRARYLFELELPGSIEDLSIEQMADLKSKLDRSLCLSKEEELEEIWSRLNGDRDGNRYFIGFIPEILKKIAHKKNRDLFLYWFEKIKGMKEKYPDLYVPVEQQMETIGKLARKRFEN
ncbi:MAG: DNA adenine methylase [Spirochaetales bacterium]|nr:DNA adenine methylase [Spirochaetales bacterium]